MKKLIVAIIVILTLVLVPSTVVFADDPIEVDITVLGNEPVVTLEADGDNATVYINGQDLAKPTVVRKTKKYYIENPYNDEVLTENLSIVGDGLTNVILAVEEHNDNLQVLLDVVSQSVLTNEEQSKLIKQLANSGMNLETILTEHVLFTDESLQSIKRGYQDANAKQDAKIDKLQSTYNNKLYWTWGSLGFVGLLLGIIKLWQIRLSRG